jgi:hypothetical protein
MKIIPWKKLGFYSLVLFIGIVPIANLLANHLLAAALTGLIAAFYFGMCYGSWFTNGVNQALIVQIKSIHEDHVNKINLTNQKCLVRIEASYKDLIEKIKNSYASAMADLFITRDDEKQFSHFVDELDLILENKTPEELNKENGSFAFPNAKVNLKGSKVPK